jgi:hypothetical protein
MSSAAWAIDEADDVLTDQERRERESDEGHVARLRRTDHRVQKSAEVVALLHAMD